MEPEAVAHVLRMNLGDARVKIERDPITGKIGGWVISNSFAGRSFLQRQNRVFRILRREFGPEAQDLSMIFTYTPQEQSALEAV